jgi:hypothetical protein
MRYTEHIRPEHDKGCRGCNEPRSLLMGGGIWRCPRCKDDLDTYSPIHTVEGVLYCGGCADEVARHRNEAMNPTMFAA